MPTILFKFYLGSSNCLVDERNPVHVDVKVENYTCPWDVDEEQRDNYTWTNRTYNQSKFCSRADDIVYRPHSFQNQSFYAFLHKSEIQILLDQSIFLNFLNILSEDKSVKSLSKLFQMGAPWTFMNFAFTFISCQIVWILRAGLVL